MTGQLELLRAAIRAGEEANAERLAKQRENVVASRLARLLADGWIYTKITEVVGAGSDALYLFRFRDAEDVELECEAVRRIAGLSAASGYEASPFDSTQVNLHVRITWQKLPTDHAAQDLQKK